MSQELSTKRFEDARNKTAEGCSIRLEDLQTKARRIIARIENAKTVDDVMFAKRDLLGIWVDTFPITTASCYFCNSTGFREHRDRTECKRSCQYADAHGPCLGDPKSTYTRLYEAKQYIQRLIPEYWTGNEKLEPDHDLPDGALIADFSSVQFSRN